MCTEIGSSLQSLLYKRSSTSIEEVGRLVQLILSVCLDEIVMCTAGQKREEQMEKTWKHYSTCFQSMLLSYCSTSGKRDCRIRAVPVFKTFHLSVSRSRLVMVRCTLYLKNYMEERKFIRDIPELPNQVQHAFL